MLGETREGNMLFSFTATEWVEVIAAATLPLTVIGCLLQTSARGAALTNRSIQIIGLLLFLPIVLILGAEKDIPEPALVTLLGAFGGYLLSNMGRGGDSAPAPAPTKANGAPPAAP
jgi:hypothetical protein